MAWPVCGAVEVIELVKNRMCLMRVLFSLLLATCFMPTSGCSKAVTRSRLVSTYEAEHENGIETLELRADGTYLHHFKATKGAESTYSDKWEFAADDPGPVVLLHNFSPQFPGNSWIKGAWGLGVKQDYGRIRLYVSYDPRHFYLERPAK